MSNRNYPKWFIDELLLEEDKIKAKLGTLQSSIKVQFVCPECGNIYSQRVASHVLISTGERKQGCPKCGIKKQVKSSRNTKGILKSYPDWFIDSLYKEKDKERAKVDHFYGNEELQFYCHTHDLVYIKRVRSVLDLKTHNKKSGCPKCIKEQAVNTLFKKEYPEWFIEDLYLEEDKERAKFGTIKLTEKVQFFCKEHNMVYFQLVRSHIDPKTNKPKYGCPKCKKDKYIKTKSETRNYPDWFINDLVNKEDKQRAKDGTLSSSEIVEFKCFNNHVYSQQVKCHIILSTQEKNRGCPNCSPYRSSTELEIEEYIQSLGFTTEHRRFHSSILPLFEADIYIPEKNVAIEYNGSFFHKTLPDDGNSKPRMYHNQKFYSFRELGIKLISIFDVDWETKREKIKQYLKDLLLLVQTRIYARKTEIRKIDYKTANTLYDQFHLLGKTTVQSVSYGLYYNDGLLACMSFQKGRYKEENKPVWCLTRFVTKSGYSIVGGASKLLSQFEKEYSPSILVSYSDNDYFSGNLYLKLGFVCDGDTGNPRYYWFCGDREIKREQCQLKYLSKLYPDLYKESDGKGNREDYIMLKLGAKKVFRSGHTKWIKKYS